MALNFVNGMLLTTALAFLFAFTALMVLPGYRRQLGTDLKSVLSVKELKRNIASAGIAGYIASGLLVAAMVCLVADAAMAASVVAPLLNMLA